MARIVVCEPSPELRRLFELTVERLGHKPLALTSVERGVPPADVMLLDVDGDGVVDEAAALRAEHPGLPMIVCSIYPRDERSRELDAVAHLVKPFTRPALERAIADALALAGTIDACPTDSDATARSA